MAAATSDSLLAIVMDVFVFAVACYKGKKTLAKRGTIGRQSLPAVSILAVFAGRRGTSRVAERPVLRAQKGFFNALGLPGREIIHTFAPQSKKTH